MHSYGKISNGPHRDLVASRTRTENESSANFELKGAEGEKEMGFMHERYDSWDFSSRIAALKRHALYYFVIEKKSSTLWSYRDIKFQPAYKRQTSTPDTVSNWINSGMEPAEKETERRGLQMENAPWFTDHGSRLDARRALNRKNPDSKERLHPWCMNPEMASAGSDPDAWMQVYMSLQADMSSEAGHTKQEILMAKTQHRVDYSAILASRHLPDESKAAIADLFRT